MASEIIQTLLTSQPINKNKSLSISEEDFTTLLNPNIKISFLRSLLIDRIPAGILCQVKTEIFVKLHLVKGNSIEVLPLIVGITRLPVPSHVRIIERINESTVLVVGIGVVELHSFLDSGPFSCGQRSEIKMPRPAYSPPESGYFSVRLNENTLA